MPNARGVTLPPLIKISQYSFIFRKLWRKVLARTSSEHRVTSSTVQKTPSNIQFSSFQSKVTCNTTGDKISFVSYFVQGNRIQATSMTLDLAPRIFRDRRIKGIMLNLRRKIPNASTKKFCWMARIASQSRDITLFRLTRELNFWLSFYVDDMLTFRIRYVDIS